MSIITYLVDIIIISVSAIILCIINIFFLAEYAHRADAEFKSSILVKGALVSKMISNEFNILVNYRSSV